MGDVRLLPLPLPFRGVMSDITALQRYLNDQGYAFRSTYDTTNVWKLNVNDEARYWRGYLSTRPKYSNEFYNLIYDYHSAHSKSFAVAHDVGAGPGQVSAKLAERFAHVVVSDNNANHVDYARYMLLGDTQQRQQQPRFSFTVAKGEELGDRYPPGSADLVACPLMFPLMETEAALQSFAQLLKPGGTLAIWFYGRAHFAEPTATSTRCQPLLDAIIDHHFASVIQGQGPAHRAGWKRAADGIASWLDYIPFAPTDWAAVERHKWNAGWATLGFFGNRACDFPVEPVSRVAPTETIRDIEDRQLWRRDWTIHELKMFVEHIFPFRHFDEEAVRPLWAQLQAEMGGGHIQHVFSWPAVLVLASRR
ncbi:class I SAM-dependent methyltransferase [Aspergillus homomorphus CBS 101889]|uniref:S-adenosyl-L-methionine-dependent methyltransferase n=1 Tax=Aspergillus homomorphus (strain CBS 101889) TaxID=1450537 RepID=A0A395HWU7_ASPHC|nr:S-adenosyl-L-methionine-dependent methyltransferase [Aspergillus homomorphus CBS 101889]RAL12392.1 S-adenosyl-L-methionine-dependent methyltransferase [Aspergillus homomorphus CBS 101889]